MFLMAGWVEQISSVFWEVTVPLENLVKQLTHKGRIQLVFVVLGLEKQDQYLGIDDSIYLSQEDRWFLNNYFDGYNL